MTKIVQKALLEWGLGVPYPGSGPLVERMPGGASTREFFRVSLDGERFVLMVIPAPDPALPQANQAVGIAPFIEVAQLLRDRGVAVPRIFRSSTKHQALLVEDLGDNTLEHYLETHPERRREVYGRIVDELANAQRELRELPLDSCVRARRFDAPLLRWEVDHFRSWALEAQGHKLSNEEESIFSACADYLVEEISSFELGFVHRDFQSRNLMVTREQEDVERITWIDFQDAMLGCRVYDLVALLGDSYQRFDEGLVLELIERFCAKSGYNQSEVEREFWLVTIQRKLKDAGRFVYFQKANDNSAFLPFVEPSIRAVSEAVQRLSGTGPLGRLEVLLRKVR